MRLKISTINPYRGGTQPRAIVYDETMDKAILASIRQAGAGTVSQIELDETDLVVWPSGSSARIFILVPVLDEL